MTWLSLSAIDVWFFRDGRPYGKGEADQSHVRSVFPPSPLTISGALRAMIARANGWNGRPRQWTAKHLEVLGNGPEDSGKLSFHGPLLTRRKRSDGDQDFELLFPAPHHLFACKDECVLLVPGDSVSCDMGDAVRLPEIPYAANGEEIWKPQHGCFVTENALTSILSGSLPKTEDIVFASDLWQHEPRIALERDAVTHTTGKEGDLYSPSYVRLKNDVSLAIDVRGLPADWQWPAWPALFPLGGENRMAACERMLQSFVLPTPRVSEEFIVCVLTPLRLPMQNGAPLVPQPGPRFFAALGVEEVDLITACVNRPVYLGGWNSQELGPLPLRSHLPAGSVLFCKAPEKARDRLLELSHTGFGSESCVGFNQFILGAWPARTATVHRSFA